jgi:hypothetical protein
MGGLKEEKVTRYDLIVRGGGRTPESALPRCHFAVVVTPGGNWHVRPYEFRMELIA